MKKGGLFKTIRVFVVIFSALVIAVVLVIMRPKAERQVPVDKGLLVEVLPAKTEDVEMVVETFGTVEPRESLKLVARVRGPIVEINPAFKEEWMRRSRRRLDRAVRRARAGLQDENRPIRC